MRTNKYPRNIYIGEPIDFLFSVRFYRRWELMDSPLEISLNFLNVHIRLYNGQYHKMRKIERRNKE